MATLELTGEQAQCLAYDEADPEWGYAVELNEQIDKRRWESVHRLVIKDKDGRFWAATYRKGLTENQDGRPFEDQAEVEFCEVEKVPVEAWEYRRKESADAVREQLDGSPVTIVQEARNG